MNANTNPLPPVGLRVQHKDGMSGAIIQHLPKRPGYFMVRFDDGITVAQSQDNLLFESKPLSAFGSNPQALAKARQDVEKSQTYSPNREIEEEILKSISSKVPITLITGEAGTGKSYFIEKIRHELKGNVAVVAFTGVAAINVRGETIHSFFGFPITVLTDKALADPRHTEKIKKLDYLIVDEVSMLRADILDAICNTLKNYGRQKNDALGGVQVILVGDFMQLDPVLESDDDAKRYFYSKYQSSFFFESKHFQESIVAIHVLKHRFRQEADGKFGEILNRVRIGSAESKDLEALNEFSYKKNSTAIEDTAATWLTNTNDRVDEINQSRLNQLSGQSKRYSAQVSGDFPEQNFPTARELVLKKNAKVMFVRNDTERNRRWVNGSIATVTAFTDSSVDVRISDTGLNVAVQRTVWDAYKYFFDKEKDSLESVSTGTFEQFPLTLAWASTIHKSQGKTLGKIYLDLPSDFGVMPSQLYVALSRTRSLDQIGLSRDIEFRDVQVNKRAAQAWKFALEHNGKVTKFNLPKSVVESHEITRSESDERNYASNVVALIQSAIESKQRVFMDYISKTGRKWRVVRPVMWLKEKAMFEAYCEENEENRSFRIDRIHEAKKL